MVKYSETRGSDNPKYTKSLIESVNARKYLVYGIDEIALILVGILIALQIDNWNEYGYGTLKS